MMDTKVDLYYIKRTTNPTRDVDSKGVCTMLPRRRPSTFESGELYGKGLIMPRFSYIFMR